MKIKVELSEPIVGNFAGIKLCFKNKDDLEIKVSLNIQFQPLYDFSKDTESTSFDLFLISSIVYGIDNLFDRNSYSIDGWTRDFEVTLPVKNIEQWQNAKTIIEECLTFLTGDYWQIAFTEIELEFLYHPRKNRRKSKIPLYDKYKYQFASLFSGGLDSLVGAVDLLEQLESTKKILLISHFDSNSVGPNSDQEKLFYYLSTKYTNKIDWVQSTITLKSKDNQNNYVNKDSNYRSRSILFLGIANYLINTIQNVNELIIPENGTISLNYPLTPSRSSSLSTRTTHPYFLNKLNEIFNKVNVSTKITNPYFDKTKGELIDGCSNKCVLEGIYQESVSCGKRGRRQNWNIKVGTNHCGICMPCIYRRAALNKVNWDNQLYGNNLLTVKNSNAFKDLPAVIDYLSTDLSKERIMRNLLINGSLPLDSLKKYADLILRSRAELKEWISSKGNAEIKIMIGL